MKDQEQQPPDERLERYVELFRRIYERLVREGANLAPRRQLVMHEVLKELPFRAPSRLHAPRCAWRARGLPHLPPKPDAERDREVRQYHRGR